MSVKYEVLKKLVAAAGLKKRWLSATTEELLENRRKQNAKNRMPYNKMRAILESLAAGYGGLSHLPSGGGASDLLSGLCLQRGSDRLHRETAKAHAHGLPGGVCHAKGTGHPDSAGGR